MMNDVLRTDRRRTDRFPIQCELVYRMSGKRLAHEQGAGVTVDMSSGGVRFRTERPLVRASAWRWPSGGRRSSTTGAA